MASNEWWDTLSHLQQKRYLKHHPTSKLKITKQPQKRKKQTKSPAPVADQELRSSTALKRPAHEVARKVAQYIKKNAGKIALAMGPVLLGMRKTYDRNVDNMPERKRNGLAAAIQTAIKLKDSKALPKLASKIGVTTGVALIALTGVALVAGVDVSLFVPLLSGDFWNDLKSTGNEIKDSAAYLKEVGSKYIGKVEENLNNEEIVATAVVEETPDVTVDENNGAGNKKSETARHIPEIVITSGHESDLNKALLKIERLDVTKRFQEVASVRGTAPVRAQRLLDHVDLLEDAIPKLATILVAAVPQRLSLSNRAKTQMSLFHRELAKCRVELATLAKQQPHKATPLFQLLKRKIKAKAHACELSFVRCENNHIRLCEVHRFEEVETASNVINKIEVFGYHAEGTLHLAHTNNSCFLPKAFETTSARGLTAWLKDTGLLI